MRAKAVAILAAVGAACCITVPAPSASAQSAVVVNPGFETPLNGATQNRARDWRHFNTARRRFVGDGLMPPIQVRSGIASMEVTAGNVFGGMDTDTFNSTTFLFNNPAYTLYHGPITWSVWINIPAANPFVYQWGGMKWEFKRPSTSVYEVFEDRKFGEGTGLLHTNGQWEQISSTITEGDFWWKFNFYNDRKNNMLDPADGKGEPWPEPPDAVSLVHLRFGDVPIGMTETGTVFFDDVECAQDFHQLGDDIEIWDDTITKAVAKADAGVLEPAIPLFINGRRIGYGNIPGEEGFKALDFFEQIPNTQFFPLAWADVFANGYVRPLILNEDGTSQIGSSVISAPSFKPTGEALDLIPNMTQATIDAAIRATPDRDLFADPVVFGSPVRTDQFTVTGTGNYSGRASLTSNRDYGLGAIPGKTQMTFTYTWTATQNITLDPSATGRGFDAFRLTTISSMLANIGLGQYDARFIGVEESAGVERTVAIDDSPRGVYLFASPRPFAVGRSVTLYQDNDATFNPGSPTIKVTLDSVSGAAGSLGIQGFLASSTNPNDDSLNAWVEWVGAPATIPSGTVITATFTVCALPATDLGDANHDGVTDCDDAQALFDSIGAVEADSDFNAYSDMNGDGAITAADLTLIQAITGDCGLGGGCCQGNANGDNVVDFNDITAALSNWLEGSQPSTPNHNGDANCDGEVNFNDITATLSNWLSACP